MKKGRIIPRKDTKLIEKLNKKYEGDETVPYMGNGNIPSSKSKFEYDSDRIKVIKRAAENVIYFAQHFFYIITDGKKEVINLHPYQRESLRTFRDNRKSIVLFPRQSGKALDVTTPINTPNGLKTMGDLKDGDKVYDERGNICNVTKAWPVMYDRPCYKITFDNGEEIVSDEDHLWFTQTRADRDSKLRETRVGSVKSTKDILNKVTQGKNHEPYHRIPRCGALSGIYKKLPIAPYILGLWLGDGYSDGSRIIVGKEDIDNMVENLNWPKYSINEDRNKNFIIYLKNCESGRFSKELKGLNLIKNKHIPNLYKQSSKHQRLELLRGLMDTDGCAERGNCTISSSRKSLAYDIYELILSLGYKATIREKYFTNINHKTAYIISFKPDDIVFKLIRKINKQKLPFKGYDNRINYHYIKKVEKVESVPVRCITVDSLNNLYVCGKTNIPTHNTTILNIYVLWLATFQEHQKIVIVANKERTAQSIYKRVQLAYLELPNWIKPGVKEWGKTGVTFDNGSEISISSTSADAIRGLDTTCLILDELAFVPKNIAEEFFSAVYPTIAASKTAKLMISSTPNGIDNIFHRLWEDANSGKNGFGYYKITYRDVPGRDEEWARTEKMVMGEDKFNQEHGCEFLESGESFIPQDLYEEVQKECRQAKIVLDDGAYKIYEKPNITERIYTAGVDIGEGVGANASTICILDVTELTNIEQVATYHCDDVGPYEFAKRVNEVMSHWGKPPLAVERNNTGGGVVITTLDKEFNYPNLINFAFKQGDINYNAFKGITSSTNTKYHGVMNMFYFFKDQRRVTLHDIDYLKELNTFVRHKNGKWAKKTDDQFDDRVDAFIWALVAIHELVAGQYFHITVWDDNKKPLQVTPLYEPVMKNSINAVMGDRTNNYGVDQIIMPDGSGFENPDMQELNDMGWMLPEEYGDWKSYRPVETQGYLSSLNR